MAIRIRVKNVKPYKEFNPEYEGKKLPATFLCKVYETDELKEIRKQYQELVSNTDLELIIAKLNKLEETGDKSSEAFYKERDEYRNLIDMYSNNEEEVLKFYKKQILYIKNASISIEDEQNIVRDLNVTDSRTVAPVESLWENAEECLDVLLDAYFAEPSLRDSIIYNITNIILNLNIEDKVKN